MLNVIIKFIWWIFILISSQTNSVETHRRHVNIDLCYGFVILGNITVVKLIKPTVFGFIILTTMNMAPLVHHEFKFGWE